MAFCLLTRFLRVAATQQEIAKKVYPCRVALFFTMFGSIFTAAFFAYADSTNGIDIEQVRRLSSTPPSPKREQSLTSCLHKGVVLHTAVW